MRSETQNSLSIPTTVNFSSRFEQYCCNTALPLRFLNTRSSLKFNRCCHCFLNTRSRVTPSLYSSPGIYTLTWYGIVQELNVSLEDTLQNGAFWRPKHFYPFPHTHTLAEIFLETTREHLREQTFHSSVVDGVCCIFRGLPTSYNIYLRLQLNIIFFNHLDNK